MMPGAGFLLAGVAVGAIYFTALRWNTALYFASNGHWAIGLHFMRLGGMAALLVAMSLFGAVPLLLFAIGVLLARPVVMRVMP